MLRQEAMLEEEQPIVAALMPDFQRWVDWQEGTHDEATGTGDGTCADKGVG